MAEDGKYVTNKRKLEMGKEKRELSFDGMKNKFISYYRTI